MQHTGTKLIDSQFLSGSCCGLSSAFRNVSPRLNLDCLNFKSSIIQLIDNTAYLYLCYIPVYFTSPW